MPRVKRPRVAKEAAVQAVTVEDGLPLATLADEFVCPITRELPVDPVVAADGCIYERGAIVRWFKRCRRSPVIGGPTQHASTPHEPPPLPSV